mgnify:FL=1
MDHTDTTTTTPAPDTTAGTGEDRRDRRRPASPPSAGHLRPHPGDPFYFDGAGALPAP